MRTQIFLIVAAALLSVLACKSNRHEPPPYDENQVTCICGTPEARFEGCHYPPCLRGEGNPDNDDCVCGSFFEDGEGGQEGGQ